MTLAIPLLSLSLRLSSGDTAGYAIMRTCVPAFRPSRFPSEIGDFADDVRQRLPRARPRTLGAGAAAPGECSPPLDVFETDDALEIVVDLPGVEPAAVRVVAQGRQRS